MTRCRPLNRKRKQNPIRCGHDPAGLRSALCRDSVRNGYALSRCVAPRCRKPTHEPPICARSVPKAALARPLPTCQTRQKGRLNFLYPANEEILLTDDTQRRVADYRVMRRIFTFYEQFISVQMLYWQNARKHLSIDGEYRGLSRLQVDLMADLIPHDPDLQPPALVVDIRG